MTCCNNNCDQGRNCPDRVYYANSILFFLTDVLAGLGVFVVVMFVFGYIYASIPLTKERTCTPDLIDRILK